MNRDLNIFQNAEVDLKVNGGPTDIGALLGTYDKVVLKPNKKGSKNVLEQWMVSTPHTKYVVKYDFNLQDTIIEMPEDSILEIDCGSLQHGTLVGHDTVLLNTNNVDNALVDITLDGTWVSGRVAPDEEDITQEKGLLKFANKAYEPNKFSGLGRVYLRKNINPAPVAEDIWMFRKGADDIVYLMYRYQGVVYHIYDEDTGKGVILENNLVKESDDYNIAMLPAAAQEHNMPYVKEGDRIIITLPNGGRINDVQLNQTEMYYYTDVEPGGEGNILTQDMINKPNTIYIIQYDYDLNGKTITIPANCVLEFDGGSISNGVILYSNTKIINANYKHCDIQGNTYKGVATPNDYGYNAENTTSENTLALSHAFSAAAILSFEPIVYEYGVNTPFEINAKVVYGNKAIIKQIELSPNNVAPFQISGETEIYDLTIDFNSKNRHGVRSYADSELTMINCQVLNSGIPKNIIGDVAVGAILIQGDAHIEGCLIKDCKGYGIQIWAPEPKMSSDGKLDYNASLAYGKTVKIINNKVIHVGKTGITPSPYHVFKELLIDGNYVSEAGGPREEPEYETGGSGIGAQNCANVVISNNIVQNCKEHSVVLQDCFNVVVNGNILDSSRNSGIRYQSNTQENMDQDNPYFHGMSGVGNTITCNNVIIRKDVFDFPVTPTYPAGGCFYIGQNVHDSVICNNKVVFKNKSGIPIRFERTHTGYSDPKNLKISDFYIENEFVADPQLSDIISGFENTNSTKVKIENIFFNGIEFNGIVPSVSGLFENKPNDSDIYVGFEYFATNKGEAGVGAMIYYTGDTNTPWVDATGTPV